MKMKILFQKSIVMLLAVLMATPVRAAEVITYFHNDISGSPALATNSAGAVLWKENYRPYGDKRNREAASATNKIGYHGKPHDDNTGLSYMGARYYDPVIGRFTGIDPVDFSEDSIHSFNRYAYANNNPYKYVDPDGRWAFLVNFIRWVVPGLFMGGAAILSDSGARSNDGRTPAQIDAGVPPEKSSPGSSSTSGSSGEKKACPNPNGCNGKQDHQDKVKELAGRAEGEAQQGESVLENKRIRGYDSNRRPDVQIVDREGRARQIYEAERNPNSARNRARQAEYDRLGVPHETHGLGR